jgi:hypothetical protein
MLTCVVCVFFCLFVCLFVFFFDAQLIDVTTELLFCERLTAPDLSLTHAFSFATNVSRARRSSNTPTSRACSR